MDHVSKDDVSRVSYTIHELQLTWLGHSQRSLSTCMLCITQNMIPFKRGHQKRPYLSLHCKVDHGNPKRDLQSSPGQRLGGSLWPNDVQLNVDEHLLASVVKPLQSSPTLVFQLFYITSVCCLQIHISIKDTLILYYTASVCMSMFFSLINCGTDTQ